MSNRTPKSSPKRPKPRRRARLRKMASVNVGVFVDVGDIVRVAGPDKARKMMGDILRFAAKKTTVAIVRRKVERAAKKAA